MVAGVFAAGLIQAHIPEGLISAHLGGNTLSANLYASVLGMLMYFATLTEVPIVQALIEKGMGNGPALTLLLAGPSLSLPSMLVIGRVLGPKKTLLYVVLVILFSALAGLMYGFYKG